MALIYNATFDSGTRVLSLLDRAGNVISSCEVPSKGDPLTLTATANNSSVKLIKNGEVNNTYEVNTGSSWVPYTFDTVINLNRGQSCKWRCTSHPTSFNEWVFVQFVMTGSIEASGNTNSMLSRSFERITSLAAPEYTSAFRGLFMSCTGLTKAPELPATTVGTQSYALMFYKCGRLTQAPELPATTVGTESYDRMFYECKRLTKAPELPATMLANFCYYQMFFNCEALTKSPELPAIELADRCYNYMFQGCPKLNEVRVSATGNLSENSSYWLYGASSTGDFYCDPNASWESGVSGIPKNWNRWVYGAEDTGTTTTMYHNGTSETVRVGTSSYGACYALQGWVGFKSLAEMLALGYTLGTQTPLTMYHHDIPVSAYSCEANAEDGFTETMYDVGNGKGYLTIAQQNANGFYLVSTPYTGLTLTATADNSSVKLTKNGTLSNTFEVDTGNGWQSYTFGTVINLNSGQSCKWRCSTHHTTQSKSNYVKFLMTGTIEASGNVNSMLLGGFENLTSLSGYDYAFYQLFSGCKALTKAPKLPATTLASYCYASMFNGCSSLVKAPDLPSANLAIDCYEYMFRDCSALTQAPGLPATTLRNYCYEGMFFGCEALTKAPGLPATTLTKYCYDGMFYGCSSLVNAPDLPATNLAIACYQSMFSGCYSLTKAPNLPATTLAGSCYRNMFENCSALAEVRIAATTTASDALKSWLTGVAASGTVYAVQTFNDLPTNNASGIPSGWSRKPLSDYPNP